MLPQLGLFASAAQLFERADRRTTSNALAQPAVDSCGTQGLVQERRQARDAVRRRNDQDAGQVFARQLAMPALDLLWFSAQDQYGRGHKKLSERDAKLGVAASLVAHRRKEQFHGPLRGARIAVSARERREPAQARRVNPV